MALNATVLKNLIIAKLVVKTGNPVENFAAAGAAWEAIAEALIEHITTAGVVSVVSVAGVTTGGGVSGPGTGSIS